jgi:hypothetical protein
VKLSQTGEEDKYPDNSPRIYIKYSIVTHKDFERAGLLFEHYGMKGYTA